MGTFTVFIPGILPPRIEKTRRPRNPHRIVEETRTLAHTGRLHLGNHPGLELIDSGPIHIGIAFTMPRPKSTPKTRPTRQR